MPTFNRSEQIVFMLLATALLIGAGVRAAEHYLTDLPDFHVIKGAVEPPPRRESETTTAAPTHGGNADIRQAAPARAAAAAVKVDVNQATAPQLITLPGVGPRTAERIIAYRESSGGFTTVEDLTNVKGIGPRTLDRMRPHLRIGKPADPGDRAP